MILLNLCLAISYCCSLEISLSIWKMIFINFDLFNVSLFYYSLNLRTLLCFQSVVIHHYLCLFDCLSIIQISKVLFALHHPVKHTAPFLSQIGLKKLLSVWKIEALHIKELLKQFIYIFWDYLLQKLIVSYLFFSIRKCVEGLIHFNKFLLGF